MQKSHIAGDSDVDGSFLERDRRLATGKWNSILL
jgi:hypothetical protein